MNTFWQDLRYGIRMLWNSPGFTAASVICLALGIGATSAIFGINNAEDCAGGPDSECQANDRSSREPRRIPQHANSIPQVLPERIHDRSFPVRRMATLVVSHCNTVNPRKGYGLRWRGRSFFCRRRFTWQDRLLKTMACPTY